jgi:hypothetical protein
MAIRTDKISKMSAGLPKTKRKHPVQWEEMLQGAIVQFHATMVVNPLDAILVAIPNGGKRDKATAGKLSGRRRLRKARADAPGVINLPLPTDAELMRPAGQGVLPGANDFLALFSRGRSCLCETKVPGTEQHAKGKQSYEQKAFERSVRALGHDYRLIWSVEDYQKVLEDYGVRLRIHSIWPANR